MPLPLHQIDAFAEGPFTGNPAAVCLLESEKPASWMQAVAGEMNLAETAFLLKAEGGWSLRWFTPAVEVDLCGHATLAAAHFLFSTGREPAGTIVFSSRSGPLRATQDGALIELDFPALEVGPAPTPPGLEAALGAPLAGYFASTFDGIALLKDEAAVRALKPDFAAIRALPVRGLVATAPGGAGGGFDFVSRFFGPAVGIDEDPVTGSAHCALAPLWAPRLGKKEFLAFQASPRGGRLRVALAGDRVRLAGCAVTVLRGELDA